MSQEASQRKRHRAVDPKGSGCWRGPLSGGMAYGVVYVSADHAAWPPHQTDFYFSSIFTCSMRPLNEKGDIYSSDTAETLSITIF